MCMDFKPPISWSFPEWSLALSISHLWPPEFPSSAVILLSTGGLTPLKNKELSCGGIKTMGQMWQTVPGTRLSSAKPPQFAYSILQEKD